MSIVIKILILNKNLVLNHKWCQRLLHPVSFIIRKSIDLNAYFQRDLAFH